MSIEPRAIPHMRAASYLLPDPGGSVVRDLLDEVERLQSQLNERLAPDPRVAVLGKVVYDLSVVASIAADVFSATDARNDLQNDALERLLYVLNDHRGIIAAQRGEVVK